MGHNATLILVSNKHEVLHPYFFAWFYCVRKLCLRGVQLKKFILLYLLQELILCVTIQVFNTCQQCNKTRFSCAYIWVIVVILKGRNYILIYQTFKPAQIINVTHVASHAFYVYSKLIYYR